jgi:hypothetical protein
MRSQPLSATAQTAYAQLLDAAQAAEMARSVADLRGSFASKQVKARTYWYFQYTDLSGKLRQLYVGPDSERVRALVATQGRGQGGAVDALARSADALGNTPLLPLHLRALARLAEYGLFRAGGVLVGTHAFLAFGNVLGVRWADGDRTQDMDFAHAGKHLELALPGNLEIDAPAAIDSLQMGLLPLVGSDGKAGASYLNPRDPDFQLDFLTPLHRGGGEPFLHPQLGVNLQPLKFMEYLLEDVQQAVLFAGSNAVVANVPHPARYALHKLVIAGERPIGKAVKSAKDLRQAAALLEWFRANAAWQVDDAWADLVARGAGWRSRAKRGRAALAKLAPELDALSWLEIE